MARALILLLACGIASSAAAQDWNGWSPTSANWRFQPREAAGMEASQLARMQLMWAFGFEGDTIAFAPPSVVDGRLYVGSARGTVHALDARSGQTQWTYRAGAGVRSAIVAVDGALLFGDQNGIFHALDAATGNLRWKRQIDDHPATRLTGSPVVHGDIVYVPASSAEEAWALARQYRCCTFRGSVTALRIRDGERVWKTYTVDAPAATGVTSAGTESFGPSGAGIWAAPTVDAKRGVLYVATGDNYSLPATQTSDAIIALDLASGRIVWTMQTTPNDVYNISCAVRGPNCPPDSGPDHDFGASVMLVTTAAGKDLLIAGQKSGVVHALDPDRAGEIMWQTRVGRGGTLGGIQWGMATDGRNVYAAISDVVLRGGNSIHPDRGGGLTALRVEDGSKVWFTPGQPCVPARARCSPAQSGAVTAIAGAVLSGSMDGHLRAYSSDDGRVMWDFDTARSYETANGAKASGGSLDGPGPVVAAGMVYVNSGYPRFGGAPGNVLLAFGVPLSGASESGGSTPGTR
jgi:polyvinyl alcohol dehydrogenase (cytochrome)